MVRGSGRSPPCVTRWSGGAVVHDRGALLRRGLRRRKTTHHVVELGSQHYRGQFNVVPGTVIFGTGCHFFMCSQDGGRRRAVDALDWHFRGGGGGAIAAALVPRGDGCTARSSAAWLPHGRSGSYRLLGFERTRRWCSSYRRDAVALASFARLLCSKFLPLAGLLVSYTASSACCRSGFCL